MVGPPSCGMDGGHSFPAYRPQILIDHMRITARLIVALALTAGLVVGGATYIQMRAERARLIEDLERRSAILAESIDTAIDPALFQRDRKKIEQFVGKFSNRGRLSGIAITDAKGDVLAATPALQGEAAVWRAGLGGAQVGNARNGFVRLKAGGQHTRLRSTRTKRRTGS